MGVEPVFATAVSDSPISRELFYAIRLLVPKGGKVLELGSGRGSTPALAEVYDLTSIEHKKDFVGMYNSPEKYIHVPLGEMSFYDRNVLGPALNFKYDLLLVDGPDEENRQESFSANLDLFDKSVPWVFDDYCYKESWKFGIKLIADKTGKELLGFEYVGKPFAVLI